MSSSFTRDLRALLRAPYAILQLETHEEARCLELLHRLAAADHRPVWEWSPTKGFNGEEESANLLQAFDAIAHSEVMGVFIFKDAAPMLHDLVLRRRLRELEDICARTNKTLVFVGPERIRHVELEKEITRKVMPLPGRTAIRTACEQVFDASGDFDIESLVTGAMGLTLREAQRAFVRVRQQYEGAIARNAPFDLEASVLEEKQRLVSNNDALEFHPLKEGIQQIGGLNELKHWLEERKDAFSPEARAFGLPAPKGLLLVGVQGCGKSLTAKAVGRYWGLPLLRLDLGRIFDGRKSPEETLRDALNMSEALAPCVLWMDEIEKGFAQDSDGRAIRVLGSLLTWLQEKTAPVFLVATANQVDALPPELLRKGRFDEIFFVDLPELADRQAILSIHLKLRRRIMPEGVLKDLAERTENFSGSELEQVVVSGLYSAFAQRRELTPEDLVYAVRDTVPLYQTYEEQIKALREWATNRARSASSKRRVLDFFNEL